MNTRAYKMTARADEAERTGARIVDAMLDRFATTPYAQLRLEDVAADAGVTVQTVLRRFGSKAGLLVAVVERELAAIVASRAAVVAATPLETVAALAEHYERYGALILKMYAEADLAEGVPPIAAAGRTYHVQWCRSVFEAELAGLDETTRERRLAQIVAVCDARTWFILRIDSGLDAPQTAVALAELLSPLLADG